MQRKSTKKASAAYDIHPVIAYSQSIVNNLPEKTGKTLDQWLAVLKKQKFQDEKQCRNWLKEEHEVGSTTASLISEVWAGKSGEFLSAERYLEAAEQYIESMYKGKEQLRPIHELLIQSARQLGDDVRICPCKTIVPFYRNHVFAQIHPSTKTRIDFGYALKAHKGKLPKRMIDTGGLKKGDRITHRIPLSSVDDIDDEVKKWMRVAYELDG